MLERGIPHYICSDNGREFVATILLYKRKYIVKLRRLLN